MRVKNNQRSAFTLIELLVVVSVMLIFIGSVLAQYNIFTQQTKLKNDAKKLLDVIELAKKKALSADLLITPGVPPTTCSLFTGYRLTLSANNYSLLYCCNSICTTNINTYTFNNTNITISSGTGNYDFPPLMNNPTFISNTIQLKNSTIDKCVNISISAIGIVELDEKLNPC